MQTDISNKLKFKLGDAIAVALVLLLALALAAGSFAALDKGETVVAEIRQNGQLVRTVELSALGEPLTVELGGDYECVIHAENGRICIYSCGCEGQDCVRTGWISRPGQSIICLPARVEITLSGSQGADIVAG